ncbi:MAG: hypothetical protein BGP00_08130 [Novosphingobium sp. 63-713]|nr:hypothetical protein [Novosphingobium sp. 1748]OJX94876.1 MAG: hypothetical protein BGP00_08130 [Novosphingobium sp. 63-713]
MSELDAICDDRRVLFDGISERNIQTTRLARIPSTAHLALPGQIVPEAEPSAFGTMYELVDRLMADLGQVIMRETEMSHNLFW